VQAGQGQGCRGQLRKKKAKF